MYAQKRKDRQGREYWSLLWRDDAGKLHRVRKAPRGPAPAFASEAEALEWGRQQDNLRAARAEHARARLAWKTKYHDWPRLVDRYAAWQRQEAPNSWKSCVSHLEKWVLPFFLGEGLTNVNDWHLKHQQFLDWLGRPDARGPKGALAAGTVNQIVRSLNTFVESCVRYGDCGREFAHPCEHLPANRLASRGVEDLVSAEELELLLAKLRDGTPTGSLTADFYLTAWHTGLRFAELFGLPWTGLFRGEVEAGPLREELTKQGIHYSANGQPDGTYVGYLYVDSQPADDTRAREEGGRVPRKPLKLCPEIGPKYARVIPIRSREVWNLLAVAHRRCKAEWLAKRWGADEQSYFFWESLPYNEVDRRVRAAWQALGLRHRPIHCCRHSFVTRLAGETRSFFLVRLMTGHRTERAFNRYLHLFEQVARSARARSQDIDVV